MEVEFEWFREHDLVMRLIFDAWGVDYGFSQADVQEEVEEVVSADG